MPPISRPAALRPAGLRPRPRRDHLVVCGGDSFAFRLVEELTVRYGERVTVITPAADGGYGPQLARLPGVRIVERPEPDRQALLEADLAGARGLALLGQGDLGNVYPALRPQEIHPDPRLGLS